MTRRDEIYNPLDKRHLADSIAREFFTRPIYSLPPESVFKGAGIYAIYYKGDYPLYQTISHSLREFNATKSAGTKLSDREQPIPIYIGKSDRLGVEKGLLFRNQNS